MNKHVLEVSVSNFKFLKICFRSFSKQFEILWEKQYTQGLGQTIQIFGGVEVKEVNNSSTLCTPIQIYSASYVPFKKILLLPLSSSGGMLVLKSNSKQNQLLQVCRDPVFITGISM